MCFGGWALTFQLNLLPPCALKGGSSISLRDSGKDSGLLQFHNCKLEFIYIYTVRIRKRHGGLLRLHEAFVVTDFTL